MPGARDGGGADPDRVDSFHCGNQERNGGAVVDQLCTRIQTGGMDAAAGYPGASYGACSGCQRPADASRGSVRSGASAGAGSAASRATDRSGTAGRDAFRATGGLMVDRSEPRRGERRAHQRARKLAADVLPGEEWRIVPDVPDMQASSFGRVRWKTGKARTGQWQKSSGQGRFILTVGKPKAKNYMVARLVCAAFHGTAPPDKPNVLHNDEDSRNNKPGNLHWGTQKENLNYPGFIAYCESRTGENNPMIKGKHRKEEL